MFVHPYIAAKLAEEHRRDLIAQAEVHRRVRAALNGRPTTQGRLRRIASLIQAVVARSVRARRPLPDEA